MDRILIDVSRLDQAQRSEIYTRSTRWLFGRQNREAYDAAAFAHDPRLKAQRLKRDEERRMKFVLDLEAPKRARRAWDAQAQKGPRL